MNSELANASTINVSSEKLIERYLKNNITSAIIFAGLEPMDSFNEVLEFVDLLRTKYKCNDDIVIYTGFNEDEIADKVNKLKLFKNIIVKFGRFVPNDEKHFDEILEVELASKNQYAKRIS